MSAPSCFPLGCEGKACQSFAPCKFSDVRQCHVSSSGAQAGEVNPGACALQVKGEVEAGISYLLRKRETDRYRHFVPRILYETASGGRQAPTFDLP